MKIIKPIVFFDLETTGTDVLNDRICQIACIKLMPDGSTEKLEFLINPGIPIPASASAIHGITDKIIEFTPKFSERVLDIYNFMDGCDLGGYNVQSFDIPLLQAEFSRCLVEFPCWSPVIVDVLLYERKLNDMKLTSVYKRYMGKELTDAHNAMSDVLATVEVLKCQTACNSDITAADIDSACLGDGKRRCDCAGYLYIKDGLTYWNFGKNKDKCVGDDYVYREWVLKQSFPEETKNCIRVACGYKSTREDLYL